MYMPALPLDSSLEPVLQSHIPARPFTSSEGNPLRSLSMENLLQLPAFSREPEQHLFSIRAAYEQVRDDLLVVCRRMSRVAAESDVEIHLARSQGNTIEKTFALWQHAYGLVLTIALFLNSTLRALDEPEDHRWPLAEEATILVEAIIKLACDMLHLRPLFSTGILNPLFLAWAVETDVSRFARVERMLVLYLEDKRKVILYILLQ